MRTDSSPQIEGDQPHIVSVHGLVEFVLQAGDLTSGGFQRRDRARLGTKGHQLVGDRLIGAAVVGVGVPQICLENDLIKEYFEGQNVSGFAYAYQYPGFNRVLQATGRVIRTETDRGIIVLIDERFTHTRYRQLFPAHWRGFKVVQNTSEIQDKLTRFWLRDDRLHS